MSAVIKLLENGETETPYKCMMKTCKEPEKKETGLKCTCCRRTVHFSCANNKPDDTASIGEWFCISECARKYEKAKSKAQFDLLSTQHEATKKLLQALADKFEKKEREDSERQTELSKCLDRIKLLEEENCRLSQQFKQAEKSNILLSSAIPEGESSNSNQDITERDALEIFNNNEDDEEFKRRLTAIFSMQINSRGSNSGNARSQKTRDEIDRMSETEKLAYYQRLHVQRLEAPKLMRYSGDPAEWLSFKASYERMRDRGEYDNETMVDKLRDSLHGEAERYVKPRLNQPFADADSIMDALKKRFFQPKEAVAKAWEKLENWTQIPDKNKKSLEHFLVEIDSYIFLCKDLDFKPELEIAVNSRLTSKLPYSIESRWQTYVTDRNLRGNITEFSEFMWSFVPNLPSREINQASTNAHNRVKTSINVVQSEERVQQYDSKKLFSNKKAKREKPECWYCGKEKRHPLYRCDEFRKLSYDEKAKFLVNNKICSKCLASNHHTSSTCPRADRIPKCTKKNCTDPSVHSTIMHPATNDGPRTSGQTVSSAPLPQLHINDKSSTLFKVVPIYVIDGYGNRVETTLLMDRAAGASLVNMEFFKKLNIRGEPYKLELSWLQPSARHSNPDGVLHDLTIAPINEPNRLIKLNGLTALDNVSLPYQEQHPEKIKAEFSYLRDAQIPSFSKQRPQILLGLPHAKWMISLETLVDFSRESSPVAEKTPLGWTICGGTAPAKPIFHCCETDSQCAHRQEPEQVETLQDLHELVKFYNSFESLGVKDPQRIHQCKEDQKATDIKNRTLKLVDNRYEIGLYWKNDDCTLPNNYSTALKRLRATEARLRQLGMVQWANDHIKSLIAQGFAREATEDDLHPAVPHKRVNYVVGFITFNHNKSPVKPRWVVDTSCKHEGVSLNSRLLKGPDNLIPLTQALFHFRERRVAVVSDVTQMYHQLVIKKEDQQVQRFLWRDCKSDAEPDIYLFTNMVFGLNCSPSQANSARIDHCENSAIKYPLASKIGLNSMDMDDAFNSEDTEHEAIHAAQQTIEMFNKISWKMVDFRSNSANVLNSLPPEVVDKELLVDLSSEDELTSRKVLGLYWDPKKDVFRFKMTNNLDLLSLSLEHDYHPTKREVLSFIMKIFDCLGLIAHFTIRGRMILQSIWRRGIVCGRRLIRDVKRALKAEMRKKIIREKVFECALLQIEDIMNSRPLTHLPVSPNDLAPLTPNYLVKLHPGYSFVSDNTAVNDGDISHMTIKAKRVSDKLASRWVKEYLPVITKFYIKGHPKRGNLELGDYVIYADPTVKPAEWNRGIIVNVYTGRDGHVRVADIKLHDGTILERRSAVRLAKLEIDNKSFASDGAVLHAYTEGSATFQNKAEGVQDSEDANQPREFSKQKAENNFNTLNFEICDEMDENHQQITNNQIIKLMTELGEAKFITRGDVRQQNSNLEKTLHEMMRRNKFEDFSNQRTARIHRIPSDCCLLKLITTLASNGIKIARIIVDSIAQKNGYYANITCENVADYDKLILLRKLDLMGTECEIIATTYPKNTLDFKGFEFSKVKWSFSEETAQDDILIGRQADKRHKKHAVPVMSTKWLKRYREYRHRLDSIAKEVNASLQEAQVAENANKLEHNTRGRSSPQTSTPGQAEAPRKPKLQSIVVIPSNDPKKPRRVH